MGPRIAELAADSHLLFPLHLAAVELLAELAGAPPRRVLDAGCGVGEYVAALDRRGLDAHGTELDARLHRVARERHPQLASRLVHGELLEVFDLVRGPLSLACCLHGALCELADATQVGDVLAQLADLARPGGRVVLEVPNFEHLAAEAQRAQAQMADDLGEIRYAVLENRVHGHDSPQSARLEGELLLLQLPPISAYREDGAELRLERAWRWPAGPDGRLTLSWSFAAPEGNDSGTLSVLPLTRAQLDPLLPGPVRWLGDYDGRDWSSGTPFSIAIIEAS